MQVQCLKGADADEGRRNTGNDARAFYPLPNDRHIWKRNQREGARCRNAEGVYSCENVHASAGWAVDHVPTDPAAAAVPDEEDEEEEEEGLNLKSCFDFARSRSYPRSSLNFQV